MISRIISTIENENFPGAFILDKPCGDGQAGSQLRDYELLVGCSSVEKTKKRK